MLCGVVGTFVVVKRLVFISGGISHAAFGGLGLCYFLGVDYRWGAGAVAVALGRWRSPAPAAAAAARTTPSSASCGRWGWRSASSSST